MLGNNRTMAVCVITLEAHQAAQSVRYQFHRSVKVSLRNRARQMLAKDLTKEALPACSGRLSPRLGIAQSLKVHVPHAVCLKNSCQAGF
jgi:hypothetical protein